MPDIKHFIPLATTPDKVFATLTTQNGLGSWWTADTTITPKVGGTAEFGFDKRGMLFRMKIESLETDRLVVMSCHGDHPEWAGTRLTWEIEPAGDGETHLRFTHANWKAVTDFCASCNTMWGQLMFRMKDYLEGRARGPQWTE